VIAKVHRNTTSAIHHEKPPFFLCLSSSSATIDNIWVEVYLEWLVYSDYWWRYEYVCTVWALDATLVNFGQFGNQQPSITFHGMVQLQKN
jgi:hypothetical protein